MFLACINRLQTLAKGHSAATLPVTVPVTVPSQEKRGGQGDANPPCYDTMSLNSNWRA